MQRTPLKNHNSNFNSLKQQIQTRLKSQKKISQIQENKSKKYQSHKKESFQYFPSYFNTSKNESFQSNKQKDVKIRQENIHEDEHKMKISQQNILEYESLQNPHFFGYQQWIQFNKKYFSHVQTATVNYLWKIIRLINYGDVFVPSGLIYQVSKCLTQIQLKRPKPESKDQNISLKQIFNQFLLFNKKTDRIQNFRQLKMYPSLQSIENQYKGKEINQKQKRKLSQNKFRNTLSASSSINKLNKKNVENVQTNVFERVYEDSKIRKNVRNNFIYQGLIQKQSNKQCVFTPQINQYIRQKLFPDQTYKPERVCQSKHAFFNKKQYFQDFSEIKNFKASSFDKSIFQNQQLEQIPGVAEHLSRKKHSESQKRKVQRFFQKPIQVFKHY